MQGELVPLRGLFPRALGRCRGCARTFSATSSKATALRKRPAAANRTTVKKSEQLQGPVKTKKITVKDFKKEMIVKKKY